MAVEVLETPLLQDTCGVYLIFFPSCSVRLENTGRMSESGRGQWGQFDGVPRGTSVTSGSGEQRDCFLLSKGQQGHPVALSSVFQGGVLSGARVQR